MLDSAHAHFLVALAGNHRAARCLDNVLGKGLNRGLSFQVNALEHITRVHLSRFESCR